MSYMLVEDIPSQKQYGNSLESSQRRSESRPSGAIYDHKPQGKHKVRSLSVIKCLPEWSLQVLLRPKTTWGCVQYWIQEILENKFATLNIISNISAYGSGKKTRHCWCGTLMAIYLCQICIIFSRDIDSRSIVVSSPHGAYRVCEVFNTHWPWPQHWPTKKGNTWK